MGGGECCGAVDVNTALLSCKPLLTWECLSAGFGSSSLMNKSRAGVWESARVGMMSLRMSGLIRSMLGAISVTSAEVAIRSLSSGSGRLQEAWM
jgi:hypothetical protein